MFFLFYSSEDHNITITDTKILHQDENFSKPTDPSEVTPIVTSTVSLVASDKVVSEMDFSDLSESSGDESREGSEDTVKTPEDPNGSSLRAPSPMVQRTPVRRRPVKFKAITLDDVVSRIFLLFDSTSFSLHSS